MDIHLVKLQDITINDANDCKTELIESGLVEYVDFAWIWRSTIRDAPSTVKVNVVFTDTKIALYYKLKWE